MEYLLLGRRRSGVGAGVGVDIFRPESELESESLKICRLRSPGMYNPNIKKYSPNASEWNLNLGEGHLLE